MTQTIRRASLSALALVAISISIVAADHSAVTPVARSGRQLQRHESFNEIIKAKQGALDLIFVGDSITQGWEGDRINRVVTFELNGAPTEREWMAQRVK